MSAKGSATGGCIAGASTSISSMPSSEAMASSLGRSSELTRVVTVPAAYGWDAGQVGFRSWQHHVPQIKLDGLAGAAGLQRPCPPSTAQRPQKIVFPRIITAHLTLGTLSCQNDLHKTGPELRMRLHTHRYCHLHRALGCNTITTAVQARLHGAGTLWRPPGGQCCRCG